MISCHFNRANFTLIICSICAKSLKLSGDGMPQNLIYNQLNSSYTHITHNIIHKSKYFHAKKTKNAFSVRVKTIHDFSKYFMQFSQISMI